MIANDDEIDNDSNDNVNDASNDDIDISDDDDHGDGGCTSSPILRLWSAKCSPQPFDAWTSPFGYDQAK